MIWSCPVCKAPLTVPLNAEAKNLVCANGHSFDRAKQGYFNLLLANKKNSQNPGDDASMLNHRREFLEAGHYQPLVDALQKTIAGLVGPDTENVNILDVGCGEGFYLASLQQGLALPSLHCAGIDIAKAAAKLAARKYPSVDWAVASSFQLPVLDESVDVLLRVFAPGDVQEIVRVLKPQGHFVRVVPGPEHLFEFKEVLYRRAVRHELPATPEGFLPVDSIEVKYPISLESNQALRPLLNMTPFLWRGKREGREMLLQAERLDVTANFVIQVYSVDPLAIVEPVMETVVETKVDPETEVKVESEVATEVEPEAEAVTITETETETEIIEPIVKPAKKAFTFD